MSNPNPIQHGPIPNTHRDRIVPMNRLRSIHLYLGCVFAPMLLFFAVSGLWQLFGFRSGLLARLATIHNSHASKDGSSLSSPWLRVFVVIMAVAFITTTLLGVFMAFKQGGNRRKALYSLTLGLVIPLLLILLARG